MAADICFPNADETNARVNNRGIYQVYPMVDSACFVFLIEISCSTARCKSVAITSLSPLEEAANAVGEPLESQARH